FTKYFKTPHDTTGKSFCEGARVDYENPSSKQSFSRVLKKAIRTNKSTVIEIFSDSDFSPSWILKNRKKIITFD
ncbi:hypothetical protein HOH45_01525, partial [bacterium]|nr:hypothetical protein [bacterium]